jgi:hypothetical protein
MSAGQVPVGLGPRVVGTNIGGRLAVLAVYAVVGSIVCIAIGKRRGPRADELEVAGAAGTL